MANEQLRATLVDHIDWCSRRLASHERGGWKQYREENGKMVDISEELLSRYRQDLERYEHLLASVDGGLGL